MTKIARTAALAATVALALPAVAPAAHAKPRAARGSYLVGVAARSINPDANGKFDGQPVYLGGYGVGGGSPVLAGRPATRVLRDRVSVRAIAIRDGKDAIAVADAELQGWVAATRDGAYGIADLRAGGGKATGGWWAGRGGGAAGAGPGAGEGRHGAGRAPWGPGRHAAGRPAAEAPRACRAGGGDAGGVGAPPGAGSPPALSPGGGARAGGAR